MCPSASRPSCAPTPGASRRCPRAVTTLAAVLDDLDSNYSGIKGRIVDEQGELRRFVNVYVGNDDVRFLESLETQTPEGTQISVIPAVAGG